MVDAAVGGKTGVDLDLGKNLIGTFWQPAVVLADPEVLSTLDRRQLRSGLVEVVKAAMIAPGRAGVSLDRHGAAIAAGAVDGAEALIAAAVRVKAEIVGADERESGRRAALNLGHTVGHALEAATGYRRFLHGEAIAWGLAVVLLVAHRRGALGAGEARHWAERLTDVVDLVPAADIEWESVRTRLARDKKAASGRVGWVLPRTGGVDLDVAVADDEARGAWEAVRGARSARDLLALF
jgi:3-dehydroquinate synthase